MEETISRLILRSSKEVCTRWHVQDASVGMYCVTASLLDTRDTLSRSGLAGRELGGRALTQWMVSSVKQKPVQDPS